MEYCQTNQENFLEQRFQRRLDIVLVFKSDDLESHSSVTVVEHRRWESFDSAKPLLQVIRCNSKRMANANSFSELNRVFHVRHVVELESNDNEPVRTVLIQQFLVTRHLFFAWLTAGCPEVNKNDFSTEARRPKSLQVHDGEIGEARSDFTSNHGFCRLRRTRQLAIAADESDQHES